MESPIRPTKITINSLQIFIEDLRDNQHKHGQKQKKNQFLIGQNKKKKIGLKTTNTINNNYSTKLDGFQRKKCRLKLVYIYITTYTSKINELLFVLDQTINLIGSSNFVWKFYEFSDIVTFLQTWGGNIIYS